MRTTIDIPDSVMKKAKIKAIEQGITLKEFFLNALKKELEPGSHVSSSSPWEKLRGKGSTCGIDASDSPFENYSGPDWQTDIYLNDPQS